MAKVNLRNIQPPYTLEEVAECLSENINVLNWILTHLDTENMKTIQTGG